jgi:hypothetical protein
MVLGGIGGCFRRVTDGLSSGETRLESLNALSEDTVYESVASRTENRTFRALIIIRLLSTHRATRTNSRLGLSLVPLWAAHLPLIH